MCCCPDMFSKLLADQRTESTQLCQVRVHCCILRMLSRQSCNCIVVTGTHPACCVKDIMTVKACLVLEAALHDIDLPPAPDA